MLDAIVSQFLRLRKNFFKFTENSLLSCKFPRAKRKTIYNSGMKYTIPISKPEAIAALGGTAVKAAEILRFKSRAAVDKWPDTLSHRDSLMVLGAVFLRQQRPAHTINITVSFGPGLAQIMRSERV